MKTIALILCLLAAPLAPLSAQVVYTYPDALDDKAFKIILLAIRNKETREKDQDLLNATANVLKDMDGASISVFHGDNLSTKLIIRYNLLVLEKGEKDLYGATLRNAIVMVNRRLTKMVKPQKIFEDELRGLLADVNQLRDNISIELVLEELGDSSLPMAQLQKAVNKVKLAFLAEDSGLKLDTSDIRMLRQMAPVAEDGGYRGAAKAMLVAAAAASGKLEVAKKLSVTAP